MKQNDTNKRIDAMHFDRLTLVLSEYAGKAHQPINPAAEIVACKGGPVVDNPITSALAVAFDRLGIARKSKTTDAAAAATTARKDASVEDSVAEALQDTALSNLYGTLYDVEYAISQILNAPGFDDAAKRAAIDAVLEKYCAEIAALAAMVFAEKASVIAETATKAGKRHSAEDLAAITAANDSIGKIVDAAKSAQDATGKLLAEKPAATTTADEGAKSGTADAATTSAGGATVPVVAAPADTATKSAIDAFSEQFAALQTLVQSALSPEALKSTIDGAVKSAVDPIRSEIAAANQRADAAETRATSAEAAKSAAEATATKAQDDALAAARQRSGAGGHQDPKEAQQTQGDAVKSGTDTAPAMPKTFGEALRALHAVKPAA